MVREHTPERRGSGVNRLITSTGCGEINCLCSDCAFLISAWASGRSAQCVVAASSARFSGCGSRDSLAASMAILSVSSVSSSNCNRLCSNCAFLISAWSRPAQCVVAASSARFSGCGSRETLAAAMAILSGSSETWKLLGVRVRLQSV